MNIVVVLGHPSADSYCAAIFERIIRALEARPAHSVTAIRLADEKFVTAMSSAERVAYETGEPLICAETKRHAEFLQRAEALIFVYPTWWSGLPAQLKGWLERVFVLGVAFRFNDNNKIRPNLNNVRHIIGVSTYGSPWRYVKLINDNGRRTLTRAIRMSTGLRTRTMWRGIYALDTCTQQQREKFVTDTVQKIVKRLEKSAHKP
ncbi:MAG: flavodoxin family protein [Actinobacteria bacterium]|nr:flavodoxin family protein [Actinomycetota bacterium]